jgi:hypothetical protein
MMSIPESGYIFVYLIDPAPYRQFNYTFAFAPALPELSSWEGNYRVLLCSGMALGCCFNDCKDQ